MNEANNPVEKAVSLILSTPDNELQLIDDNQIAKASGVDYLALNALFKKDRGLEIGDFIRREMIHRAAFILEFNQKMKVPVLSSHLGFDDLVDFESAFEAYFCCKPGRYRQLKQQATINHGGRR